MRFCLFAFIQEFSLAKSAPSIMIPLLACLPPPPGHCLSGSSGGSWRAPPGGANKFSALLNSLTLKVARPQPLRAAAAKWTSKQLAHLTCRRPSESARPAGGNGSPLLRRDQREILMNSPAARPLITKHSR